MRHSPIFPFLLFLISAFPSLVTAQVDFNDPGPGAIVHRDLEYRFVDGISMKLDLYLPAQPLDTPLPVVLWVHGGGWKNGSKKNCRAAWMVPHGYAAASISYRLTDVGRWPDQINDLYAAVRWLRSHADHFGLDPNRFGVWGSSAGGHLAALLATRAYPGPENFSSRVQAACDWFGPTNLLTMPPNNISPERSAEAVANSNGAKLLGATVREVPDLARDASALFQVSPDAPPFLIMHGSEDPGVPLAQSEQMHRALLEAGVASELVVIPGAGHGGKLFLTPDVQATVLAFFNRALPNSGK